MIISHKYKFIFIKTGKTAGTSIEVFLSPFCGELDVLTPIIPHLEPHRARNYEGNDFRNHMPATQVRERVPNEVWSSYYKFCVERNPWDKTLSHYHMLNYRAGGVMTLDDYFAKSNFCSNFSAYSDKSGKLLVDEVKRYEQLSEELRPLFSRWNIPFNGDLGIRAKGEYRTDHRHYREVLSDTQATRIAEVFSREIEMFGYEY